MCWLDKVFTRNVLKLRDRFGIRHFVETGTAEGNGMIYFSRHFLSLDSCEVDPELARRASERIRAGVRDSSRIWLQTTASPDFLKYFRAVYTSDRWSTPVLFFLDAHTPGNWPILEELEALKGFHNCCIVIHDFKVPDLDLGYISYEGQALDLEYVREALFGVNPEFHLYHNTREMAEVWTKEEVERGDARMPWDEATKWQLDYAWSAPLKTYRGILYAVPEEVQGLEVKPMKV
ncbi:MAG: hypothetical protein ABIH46_02525 [Chloroflexota bacterium]